jgi:outer membrane lipoprotein-sorting protein
MLRWLIVVSTLLVCPALPGISLETVSEIRECVQSNFPARTSSQEVRITTIDRIGSEQILEAEFLWKRFPDDLSRLLVRVARPPDLRGSAYLLIEREGGEEMFTYLPELQKVRRINARMVSGSLFGTDFSYEDVAYLQGLGKTKAERLPDSAVVDRSVYVLAGEARLGEQSSYDRVVSYIDRKTCVVLKVEFFEGDELRKVLLADSDSLTQKNDIWIPLRTELRDLRDSTSTRLEIERVEFDVEIRDREFGVERLERRR